jgi:hypothetical protein
MIASGPGSLEEKLGAVHGSVRLIHGLVSHETSPPHFHCWIEFEQHFAHDGFPGGLRLPMAHDRSNGNDITIPADVYRHLGRATDIQEYTPTEALQHMVKLGHYGPWNPALYDHPEPTLNER